MPQIIVTQPFRFAHHGHDVEAFEPGAEPRDTTDECAALAIAEGWARSAVDPAPAERQAAAHPAAPQNRDAAPQRKTKAPPPTAG